jgi:hypothetical protein
MTPGFKMIDDRGNEIKFIFFGGNPKEVLGNI